MAGRGEWKKLKRRHREAASGARERQYQGAGFDVSVDEPTGEESLGKIKNPAVRPIKRGCNLGRTRVLGVSGPRNRDDPIGFTS